VAEPARAKAGIPITNKNMEQMILVACFILFAPETVFSFVELLEFVGFVEFIGFIGFVES